MATRPVMLLVPLLGLILAFALPDNPREMAKTRRGRGGAAAAATGGSNLGAWGSPFRLKKHMVIARDWASQALKRGRDPLPFTTPVEAIVSNPDDAARIIAEDYDHALGLMGAKDAKAKLALARTMAGYVLAVYAPKTGAIHILPENAKRAADAAGDAKLMSEDVLRLLLVRMCLIALDRQHVPEWKAALDSAADLDALNTAGTIFQGRVQVQTRRVGNKMNATDPDYEVQNTDRLVTLLTAPVSGEADPALVRFAASVKFAILKGEKFMENVPRKFHLRILKAPPTKANVIFDPKTFVEDLRNAAKRAPVNALPGKVHKAFTDGLMSEGNWTHEPSDVSADDAKAMLAPLESRYFSTAMAAFRTGWKFSSRMADASATDTIQHEVYLLEFRNDGQAEGFVTLLRGAAKDRAATTSDGAGRDLGLAGFHGSEDVGSEDPKQTWFMQWASEGPFVLGIRTTRIADNDTKREPIDEAMEVAAEEAAEVSGSRDSRRRRRGG